MDDKEENLDGIALPEGATTRSETQIRIRTDKFQQIYTNNIQIGFSAFDMALAFGQIIGEKGGKVVIEETTRVLMPRELAKVLAGLLTANIQAYEQQFGEIKIPLPLQDVFSSDEGEPTDQVMTSAVKNAKRPKK